MSVKEFGVGFREIKKGILIIVLGLLLSGCASNNYYETHRVPVSTHYTECGKYYSDIREIAKCGKNKRKLYLFDAGTQQSRLGSSKGDMYVIFMDTLAEAVDNGELSNTQAKLEWMKTYQQSQDQGQGQTIIIGQRRIPKVSCAVISGVECF